MTKTKRFPTYFGAFRYSLFGSKPLSPSVTAVLSRQEQLESYRHDGIKSYHYVIDAQYHHRNDPLIFDKENMYGYTGEKGYLRAMCAALKCVTESRGVSITTDFIVDLHQLATKDVLFKRMEQSGSGWGVEFLITEYKPALRTTANTPQGFGFYYVRSSTEGIDEIKTKYGRFAEVYEPLRRIEIKNHTDIVQEMNIIIEQYYRSRRTNLDIAIFAHEMNLLHPFTDGNIRVITFLLVNKLLLDEGRPPIMFFDPNIFDAFSCEQLGEFIDRELQLSGALCQDLHDPFCLNEEFSLFRGQNL